MAEQGRFRGEGGRVWTLGLPLRPELADQLAKGLLVEVDAPDAKPKRQATAKPKPEQAAGE